MRCKSIYLIRIVVIFLLFFVVRHFWISRPKRHIIPHVPVNNTLIDWHNYDLINSQKLREGFGEHGIPVILTSEEKTLSDNVFRENGFSRVVSDKISLQRVNPDLRHPDCRTKLYFAKLPSVSVVIPVFQEHWTTLLRTITSIIVQSPPNLIKEIILVDDGSFKPFLKEPLDEYCIKNYPKGLVVVIHHPKRVGLITARLTGAKVATGDVLIFLDSHVEATTNWLPPLLHPIAKDYKTVVCPFIDVIDMNNFEYRAQDEGARGAFDWILNYKRLPRLPEDASHPADPFYSPVMAGGLFAISAKWFWELGGYDPGLAIWGGEQYELSFKIWMCGGTMVDAPCSRIGHIYRGSADFPDAGVGNFLAKNYKRLMDVWMDEYAEYVYRRRPSYRSVDPGDLTEQRAIRTRLNCKSFKWFMTEVAFDLTKKYPYEDPIPSAYGKLRTGPSFSLCLTVAQDQKISIVACSDNLPRSNFTFSWRDDISVVGSDDCFDVQSSEPPSFVTLFGCHGGKGNQAWSFKFTEKFDENPFQLVHSNHLCLEADPKSLKLFMNTCSTSVNQLWHWDTLQRQKALAMYQRINIEP